MKATALYAVRMHLLNHTVRREFFDWGLTPIEKICPLI
jgi:hypothetical protein